MFAKTQRGSALKSFIFGGVFVLILVIGFLLYLEKNEKRVFQQPELLDSQQQIIPKVESLIPSNVVPEAKDTMASSVVAPVRNTETISSLSPDDGILAQDSHLLEKNEFRERDNVDNNTRVQVDSVLVDAVRPAVAQTKKNHINKKENTYIAQAENIQASTNDTKANTEEIAPNRSVGKTRQETRDKRENKKTLPSETKKTQRIIQAGAFSSREAADKQRAKLALQGVSSRIIESKSGNKTIYRVQTNNMSNNQATEVNRQLRENGIDSFIK